MPRLTHAAHECLAQAIQPSDLVIDATAGNGHDTLFLAKLVGDEGRVLSIDRQASAIKATRRLLMDAQMEGRVVLHEGDHADLINLAPEDWLTSVTAVVFNLGYLPGSDKSVITTPGSTYAALTASLNLLKTGGMISVLIYRGHAGGHDEESVILGWLDECSDKLNNVNRNDGEFPTPTSPRLLTVIKS